MVPQFDEAVISYVFLSLAAATGMVGLFRRSFYYANVFQPSQVFRGRRIWTLFSSALVHGSWWHLLLNIAFCLVFMTEVEYMLVDDFGRLGGRWSTAGLLVATVVACNLIDGCRLWKKEADSTIGLSGLTCAIMVFYYAYFPLDKFPGTLPFPESPAAYHYAAAITAVCAAAYWVRIPGNQFIHLVGCIIGLLATVVVRPQAAMELFDHFCK